MDIIVDTHIFLWSLSEPSRLTEQQRVELETPVNTIWLSSVSVTEIMIKSSLGKLSFDFDLLEAARASGYELLEYSAEDALPLKDLPFHHKDPFDRMIISQSMVRGYPVMSNDLQFSRYPCKLLPGD
jgi:PIN domain nuclease of toxin-antitoxin system